MAQFNLQPLTFDPNDGVEVALALCNTSANWRFALGTTLVGRADDKQAPSLFVIG
jgi:hypothetical protein